jgi:glucose-1-phosphate adenylyltransferase
VKERRHPEKIVAFVLAGGEGTRLRPLTLDRCKPAVPFGGRYRIVDFVLSNLINSGVHSVYLLVQYKAQSLIEHVRKAWTISPLLPDQFVTIVPPQLEEGRERFRGTADAVYQNLNLLAAHDADEVAVFGADHIYRMDIRQMLRFHREREAEVTVATIPVPASEVSRFGIVDADAGGRIRAFHEKPESSAAAVAGGRCAHASLGNYLFEPRVLERALLESHRRGETDFGRHVLPRLLAGGCRVYAYDLMENEIPGLNSWEERGYWRDVGSLDAYFEAHHDVLGLKPRFDAFNPAWPIYSSHYQGPVARVIDSHVDNCLLGGAVVVDSARISDSIIRRESVVEPGAELDDCVIMDYVRIGKGARLRKVIIDRHNDIAPGTVLGYDPEADRARHIVTPGGVVVVEKGDPRYYPRGVREGGAAYRE